jgi:hypothetical protein
MVEVATLFISYFRDWLKRKENIKHIGDARQKLRAQQELERVDSLVYTINDMVEERGFEGRFAALTVCIFNSASGVVSICHAGDNIVHVYKGAERSVVHKELPKAPAAGTFPSMLVEMQSPYKQVPQKLESGDVLFLHTDGFEESKRYLRDASFKVAPCAEPGLKEGDWHLGTHEWGKDTEEFGTTRMDGIINAVFARGRYTLVRNHNSIPNEELEFDFSSCGGTAKEAVLALIAVEKIYRMVPDPAAGEASRVAVDAKVDTFLQQHFLQYRKYFSHPAETQSVPGYVTFTHAHEDEQYDDLTILVLRRK